MKLDNIEETMKHINNPAVGDRYLNVSGSYMSQIVDITDQYIVVENYKDPRTAPDNADRFLVPVGHLSNCLCYDSAPFEQVPWLLYAGNSSDYSSHWKRCHTLSLIGNLLK